MTSAGKWVLGLLLLVVGAVFVARTVSSDPGGSSATVKNNLPDAAAASAAKDAKDAAAVAAAAKKKIASTIAGDLSCKKACVEVNEVAADSITTAKLAPGSVTLSKLAFEVPNLNELENEINARKAAEASVKAAQAEAAAAGAKNDAAITAAASNGITQEAAARTAADEDLAKKTAAADADLLSKLNTEVKDRGDADNVLQGKLNTEIADRAGAINNLRSELGNGNQVAAPIVQINNNEIVGDAVTGNKILDTTITAADLGNDSVVGGLGGDVKDDTIANVDLADDAVVGRAVPSNPLTNVTARTLRGEREVNTLTGTTLSAGDLALGTITGEMTPLGGVASGNLALGTIGTKNIANGQVTFEKLGLLVQQRIEDLEAGLAAEIVNRTADVDQEEADRKADVDLETADRIADVDQEEADRKADVDLETADRITDVNLETTERLAADAFLQTQLNTEITNRTNADTALQTGLNNEVTAREATDAALAGLKTALGTVAPSAVMTNGSRAPNAPTAGDRLVDWSRLGNVPSDFADNKDDDGSANIQTFKNELDGTTGDTTVNETTGPNQDPVSWFKLRDVPTDFVDGDVGFGELSGTIGASQIAADTITSGMLAGTYTDHDSDPSTPDQQSVPGAVTSAKILDGTIGTRDLADGAVTGAKLDATLSTEITDLRTDLTAAEANITALQGQFTDLADPAKPTPDVASNHITGLTLVDADAVPAPTPIAANSSGAVILPIPNVSEGDLFTLRPPLTLQNGMYVTGYDATAPGVVTVSLFNSTGGSLTPPTSGWRVRWLDLTGP